MRSCLYRPGGPLPSLHRAGSKATAAAPGQLPPRPSATKGTSKPPAAKAAAATKPPAKRSRVRGQFMSASTAAAAAALHQWRGRDPVELQAIIDRAPPVAPPLVAAGPPQAPPQPSADTLEEERCALQTYREVVARREAFPKVQSMFDCVWTVLNDC